ncbi:signal transduction histidine kinase [Phycicoccus badiiscoriae]|uniref:histidine kinase n=1 Tax=Pedococcus badiiscoriae TaxID=642776 RepID=A0A852WDR3_9MICO|nr:HAMP domain-containing sensor histidine kinase [Pedococcus badiiscoriae]NYG07343.1 signal transduction histidine kinase [Pedococcus badiiscoriae]
MRTGVRRVAVVAVAVALLLFGLPLGVVTRALLQERELAELEVLARTATLAVGATTSPGDPVELPPAQPPTQVGVYDAAGIRRNGAGPDHGGVLVARARHGATATGWDQGQLAAVVPVVSNEHVVAVVRAGEPAGELWKQVALAWGLLAGAALIALLAALAVARRQSRALVEPLEKLAVVASRVSEGDLTARASPSDVTEVDLVGRAHNAMVSALVQALESERRFSAEASHQLRTPLARLRLEIEEALDDPRPGERLERALGELSRLQDVVADVLLVARRSPLLAGTSLPLVPLGEVVRRVGRQWHGPLSASGRPLTVHEQDGAATAPVAARIVEQVLEILLDNASRHGRGRVQVVVREAVGVPAVDVSDEGHLTVPDPFGPHASDDSRGGSGLGLPLARTMAEAVGARLTLSERTPTTFTLFLPEPVRTRWSGEGAEQRG